MSASSPQRPPSAGLVNVGNSCFVSAVVQSLYLTDGFRRLLTSLRLSPGEMQRYGVLRSLQHLFGLLLFGVRSEYRPAAFLSSLPERFHNGSQQDADEFAKFLLDAISSSITDIHKQRASAGKRKAEEMEAGEAEEDEERNQPQPVHNSTQRSDSTSSGSGSGSIAAEASSNSSNTAMADVSPSQPRLSQGKIRGGAQASPKQSASGAFASVPSSAVPTASSAAREVSASSSLLPPLVAPPAVSSASAFRSAALPQHDVDANFGGLARSCITCLRCGLQSVKDEAFLELPLPMQQMDSEQRRKLQDSIDRAREEAQQPQPEQQTQHNVSMEVDKMERAHGQQAMEEEKRTASSAVPEQANLPLDVLARIAHFASPLSLPLNRSFRTAHSTQPRPVAPSARLAASAALTVAAFPTHAAEPLSSSPVVGSSTAVSAARPAVIVPPAPSASSSPSLSAAAASLPRLLSSTDRLNSSAMQDSPISSVMSPSSASVFLPASSSSSSSTAADGETAAKLLAACLAQFALQAQALTSVATLTTAAAIAQKVRSSLEEQQSAEAEKEKAAAAAAAAESSEQCTALVIYAPPPHSQLQTPTESSMDVAAASSLSDAADGFSLVGSTSSSSSRSSMSSSSAALLHLPAMLDLYLSPELLAGADAYHCSHCASKQAATKALTVQSPPPHLLICLKRNEYHTNSRTRTKILTEVKFPCILHLPVTVSAPAAATSSAASSACTYGLYSVVVHSGLNADSGHYYAIGRWSGQLKRRLRQEMRRRRREHERDAVQQQQQQQQEQEAEAAAWLRLGPELEEEARAGDFFLFNDSSVSAASFSTIAQVTKRQQQDVAYLLFYVRLDGESEADGEEQEAVDPLLSVNPMLRKLAELEQLSFRRQQEKAVREAVQAAMQTLPKLPDYDTAAMQDYTDPDQ